MGVLSPWAALRQQSIRNRKKVKGKWKRGELAQSRRLNEPLFLFPFSIFLFPAFG